MIVGWDGPTTEFPCRIRHMTRTTAVPVIDPPTRAVEWIPYTVLTVTEWGAMWCQISGKHVRTGKWEQIATFSRAWAPTFWGTWPSELITRLDALARAQGVRFDACNIAFANERGAFIGRETTPEDGGRNEHHDS